MYLHAVSSLSRTLIMQILMLKDYSNMIYAPPLCGKPYLYGSNAGVSVSSRLVATLTMHLRETVLQEALQESMVRFPQIAVCLKEEDGQLLFAPHAEAVRVCHADSSDLPASFGLGEYLFRVTYRHRTIYFDFHKSLIDEYGMMAFAKSVIFRYIELCGYPIESDGTIKMLSGSFFPAEAEDPMSGIDDINASRPVWYMDAKAVRLTSGTSSLAPQQVAQVRIPVGKLRGEMTQLATMPVTYVAPVFSHALFESAQGMIAQGEYVVASVKINMRPYFPSATLRPFTTPVYLAYNRNLQDYPYGTVLMSQKKLLEAQLKPDTLAYSAQRQLSQIQRAFDGTCAKEGVAKMFDGLSSMATYEIASMGNVIFPDSMQRYVTEFYPVNPSGLYAYSVTIVNFKGEIVITIAGCNPVHALASRLAQLLCGNDIAAYVSDEYEYTPVTDKF